MKIKEDLAGYYSDLVRPVMTADGTVSAELQKKYLEQAVKVLAPKEPPAVEQLYDYSTRAARSTRSWMRRLEPGQVAAANSRFAGSPSRQIKRSQVRI
jgi:hypothetical protein